MTKRRSNKLRIEIGYVDGSSHTTRNVLDYQELDDAVVITKEGAVIDNLVTRLHVDCVPTSEITYVKFFERNGDIRIRRFKDGLRVYVDDLGLLDASENVRVLHHPV